VGVDIGHVVRHAGLHRAHHCRLATVGPRDDGAADALRRGAAQRGQHATHGMDGAGERELTEQRHAGERVRRHLAERGQRGRGDGQIECAACLA
jgi:hypothetical protein